MPFLCLCYILKCIPRSLYSFVQKYANTPEDLQDDRRWKWNEFDENSRTIFQEQLNALIKT